MHRYLSSFLLTLIAYSIIGALIVFFLLVDHEKCQKIKVIAIDKVCLTMVAKEAKIEPQVEEVPKPIEPKPEPKPEPTPKPKPIIKKSEPKPIAKQEQKVQDTTPQIAQEPLNEEPSKEINPKIEPIKKEENRPIPKPAIDEELLLAKRQKFISELINRINSNKSYPNSARRRAIEGEVEVAFTITPEGSVRDIEIISGHDIFKNSITEAIQNSFPIKIEDGIFEFPKKFKISILYILK